MSKYKNFFQESITYKGFFLDRLPDTTDLEFVATAPYVSMPTSMRLRR